VNEAETRINSVGNEVINGASRSFPRQAANKATQILGFAKKRKLTAQQWQCCGSYRLFLELGSLTEDQR
jgi:hypothetical protein